MNYAKSDTYQFKSELSHVSHAKSEITSNVSYLLRAITDHTQSDTVTHHFKSTLLREINLKVMYCYIILK